MKTLKIIATIIFLIILSQSCKNVFFDKYTKVHGYVKEEGTDKGIENVKLEVERIETTTLKKDILDVIDYSDSKGYFELKFNKDYTYSSVTGYYLEPYTENGTWELLPAEGDYKDDERIKLTPKTSITGESGDELPIGNGWTYNYIIIIKNLTKDKFEFDYEFTQEDGYIKDIITGSKKFIEK